MSLAVEKEPVYTIASPSAVISTSPYSVSPSGFVISVYETDADAELLRAALFTPPFLLGAQLLVAGGIQRKVERTLVVARVIRHTGVRLVRERVLGMKFLRRTSAGSMPISAA